jgi:hypothetical protein
VQVSNWNIGLMEEANNNGDCFKFLSNWGRAQELAQWLTSSGDGG